jgi:hypothetical protein
VSPSTLSCQRRRRMPPLRAASGPLRGPVRLHPQPPTLAAVSEQRLKATNRQLARSAAHASTGAPSASPSKRRMHWPSDTSDDARPSLPAKYHSGGGPPLPRSNTSWGWCWRGAEGGSGSGPAAAAGGEPSPFFARSRSCQRLPPAPPARPPHLDLAGAVADRPARALHVGALPHLLPKHSAARLEPVADLQGRAGGRGTGARAL